VSAALLAAKNKNRSRPTRREFSTREALDMKHRAIALTLAAGLVAAMAGAAVAQPKDAPKPGIAPAPAPMKAAPAPGGPMAPPKIEFADPDMAAVANALTGSWKCTGVPHAGGGGNSDVVLSVAPIRCADMPNVMYAELARADALNRPHRQAIWQLHKVNDKLRLKTLEFRRTRGELLSASGLWAAPEAFPAITSEDLVTTLDIDLEKVSNGWKGKTPHNYPTSMGGAVEMSSEVSISPDAFISSDRGYDAGGKEVWGPGAENPKGFTFHKFDTGVKVERLDGGVVVVDFPAKLEGAPAKPGDKVMSHYSMYLGNGWMFDSSYERGSPMTYIVGGKFLEGWKRAMADAQKGMQRKIVIPGPLAFGESGELRGKVPANATLYVDVVVTDVVSSGAAPMGAAPVMQPVDQKKQEAIMKQKLSETAPKTDAPTATPPKK
jgi:hypothetical protein